jgi:hypothetical protein
MNYKPFCGYWFYGGADSLQRAAFYCSWGLMAIAGSSIIIARAIFAVYYRFRRDS